MKGINRLVSSCRVQQMFGLLMNVLFVKIVFEFAVKPLLCDLPFSLCVVSRRKSYFPLVNKVNGKLRRLPF